MDTDKALKNLVSNCSDEFGWVDNDEFMIWLWWFNVDEFLQGLKSIFGWGLFDDGGFDVRVIDDNFVFNLYDILSCYDCDLKEIFQQSEYKH